MKNVSRATNKTQNKNDILSPWQVFLIVIDFIFFYLTFFDLPEIVDYLNGYKGIFCTLFLGITFWIIVLSFQRKRNKKKSEENKTCEILKIVKENKEILKSMQKPEGKKDAK